MQMLTQLQERKLAFVRAHARWMGIDLIATGNQLCAQRRKHHLSQEFLSELFDAVGDSASRIAISNWENGKKLPSLKHVVFLSVLYGCSLDELVVSRGPRPARPFFVSFEYRYHEVILSHIYLRKPLL